MKKIPRVLSLALVVGLIAAIPASTQMIGGSIGVASNDSDLPMLILVNRLELSEEQMNILNDILADLIDEQEQIRELAAGFEDEMIEFNGTGEELDAMLATFQEDRAALAEALRESIEVSLDQIRDLLSINQGLVLQEQLPQLLGRGSMGAAHSRGRLVSSDSMRSLGQGTEDEAAGTMREHMQERFKQLGDQVPEELIEQLKERFGGALEEFGARLGQRSNGNQPGGHSMLGQVKMGQRGGVSPAMQHMQTSRSGHGNLFEILEQIKDVLDLKLEALE